MQTIYALIEDFRIRLNQQDNPGIQRVILFGSASYDDFIMGYSDLDIFVCMDVASPEEVLEKLVGLKEISREVFPIKNIDYTIIRAHELECSRLLTLNPFIYEEIRLGLRIYGPQLPDVYTNDQLRRDSLYVAAMGLRGLRAIMGTLYNAKPVMVLRRCDELLFKSTKALLTHLTGAVHSSKAQTFQCLQEWVKDADISIYKKLLDMRNKRRNNEEIYTLDYDKIFLESLIAFEKIWDEVLT